MIAGVTGVLLDIDGVLVVSWEPIEGAAETLEALRAARMPVRFVTNTTSLDAAEIVRTLRSAGLDLDDSELLTAGRATAAFLSSNFAGATAFVLADGPSPIPPELEVVHGTQGAAADVVVVGGAGSGFDWDSVNTALRALLEGAALVGVHGAVLWQTSAGACLDGGAYLRMLAEASGVEPSVVGKPEPEMFLSACRSMSVDPHTALMVGDDLHSDVIAARRAGLHGVLVRTGKFRPAVLRDGVDQPDEVIDSIAALPDLLGLG